jgi:hypothetical protein
VSNAGDIALENVTVTDDQAGFITQIETMAPGETATYSASYTPTNCGASTSTVTATALDGCTGTAITNRVTQACVITCPPSAVTILNPRIEAGKFTFSFLTQTGSLYTVQFTPALLPINWQLLTNFTATGPTAIIQDDRNQTQRFYRVQAQ